MQARNEAEAANRAKADFLAVMSHELRTPLNAIGGYVDLIELGVRGPITPEQRTDLARIQNSQQHLLGLINGVLNYSRLGTGAVQYAVQDVPLGEALAAAHGMMAPLYAAQQIACDVAGCDPALRVRADAEKLQQIVLNLLTNALKFTEPGGRVTLSCPARQRGRAHGRESARRGHRVHADAAARVSCGARARRVAPAKPATPRRGRMGVFFM